MHVIEIANNPMWRTMIQCIAIILENRSKRTIFEINEEWVNKE